MPLLASMTGVLTTNDSQTNHRHPAAAPTNSGLTGCIDILANSILPVNHDANAANSITGVGHQCDGQQWRNNHWWIDTCKQEEKWTEHQDLTRDTLSSELCQL